LAVARRDQAVDALAEVGTDVADAGLHHQQRAIERHQLLPSGVVGLGQGRVEQHPGGAGGGAVGGRQLAPSFGNRQQLRPEPLFEGGRDGSGRSGHGGDGGATSVPGQIRGPPLPDFWRRPSAVP